MPPIRYTFFDAAGTLLWKPALYPTIQGVLARHGAEVERERIAERHRLVSEIVVAPDRTSPAFYDEFNRTFVRAVGVLPTPALLDELYAACRGLPWAAYDDVTVLRRLTQPLGVIANWDTRLTEHLSRLVGIEFFRVLGSEEHGVRKPDAALYETAVAGLGCAAAEVAYVGDSLRLDVEPALAVGMTVVLLDRLDLYPSYTGLRARDLDGAVQALEGVSGR